MTVGLSTKLAMALVIASSAAMVVVFRGDEAATESKRPSAQDTAVVKAERPVSEPPVVHKKIEKLEIDVAGMRVLLPGDGWISATDFWDIYYNQPHRLPGEIDFDLLQELEHKSRVEKAFADINNDTTQPASEVVDDTQGS